MKKWCNSTMRKQLDHKMSKSLEQTFLQRRYTVGSKHEKRWWTYLSVREWWLKAPETPLHTHEGGYHQESPEANKVLPRMEASQLPLWTAGGNVKGRGRCGRQYGASLKHYQNCRVVQRLYSWLNAQKSWEPRLEDTFVHPCPQQHSPSKSWQGHSPSWRPLTCNHFQAYSCCSWSSDHPAVERRLRVPARDQLSLVTPQQVPWGASRAPPLWPPRSSHSHPSQPSNLSSSPASRQRRCLL